MKRKTMISAMIMVVITIIGKIAGISRDTLIASNFGATYVTDAYLIAFSIPGILFGIFGDAITTTFIPFLGRSYKEKGKNDMLTLANSIINIIFILSSIMCIICWFFVPELVNMFASRASESTFNLAVYLTKYSIINLVFISLTSGYIAILQTLDEFTTSSLIGIVVSLPIIIYLVLSKNISVFYLNIITVLGFMLQLIIQFPWLRRVGYKYKFRINLRDERLYKMAKMIMPVIIGTGVNQINSLVEKSVASGLQAGSIAAIDFSNKLNLMVYSIFASVIVILIYPKLSKVDISDGYENFKDYISKGINNINLIMIPAAIGMMVLRIPIVTIIFKHGIFNNEGVEMTSTALLYLTFGMVFYGIRDICNRAFYSLHDTKTPMINGAIAVISCIILNLVIVRYMGIGGLTLSATISGGICSILLLYNLRKKIGTVNGKYIFVNTIKMLFSSVVMGGGIFYINGILSNSLFGIVGNIINLFICILAGSLIYIIMNIFLKVKEVLSIFKYVKSKFNLNLIGL